LREINYNYLAWVEGFAIAAAVFLVASVGSFVDYRKEVEFVKKRTESNKKNVVSGIEYYSQSKNFEASDSGFE
jgi:hypothetical protein